MAHDAEPSLHPTETKRPSAEIVFPDGDAVADEAGTERKKQRRSEDESYVPVIIKRNDEHRRHPDDALDAAIFEGLEQLNRPLISLALSSFAAGLTVGFSAMAVGVMSTLTTSDQLLGRCLTAVVYPLGFVVCILSGAQLFTEHTATALYPVLDKKADFRQLLRLWSVVIAGNLTGAAAFALLLALADEVTQARRGYVEIGLHLTTFSGVGLLVSSILAGWLMALGAWLAISTPRTIAQILLIYTVTFLIGIGGLHHSIAGSVELFTAMLMSLQVTVLGASKFVCLSLIGNLVGGSCFVALLNYGHIRKTNK